MVADVTLRYLTMAESRTGERGSQPEFEAFYLRTALWFAKTPASFGINDIAAVVSTSVLV